MIETILQMLVGGQLHVGQAPKTLSNFPVSLSQANFKVCFDELFFKSSFLIVFSVNMH